jgi:hypothetical protein
MSTADESRPVMPRFMPSRTSYSGDPPPEKRWRFLFGKSETFLDTVRCRRPFLPG